MFIHTKYSKYSNDEFLRLLDSKRGDSPIIDELIARFSMLIDEETSSVPIKQPEVMCCPICEGTVHLSTDTMLVDDEYLVNYKLTINPVVPREKTIE